MVPPMQGRPAPRLRGTIGSGWSTPRHADDDDHLASDTVRHRGVAADVGADPDVPSEIDINRRRIAARWLDPRHEHLDRPAPRVVAILRDREEAARHLEKDPGRQFGWARGFGELGAICGHDVGFRLRRRAGGQREHDRNDGGDPTDAHRPHPIRSSGCDSYSANWKAESSTPSIRPAFSIDTTLMWSRSCSSIDQRYT